jgi:exodeoxyribonuclease-3
MRIGTWNVNGLRARYAEVVAWAARERLDAFCLQEIKAAPNQVPEPLTGLPAYHNYWHGAPGGYSGVSIHLRRGGATPVFAHPPFDVDNRIVEATAGSLRLVSVYVPNGNRDYPGKLVFLEQLAAYVTSHCRSGSPLLVCGDLNVARTDMDIHPKEKRKPDLIGIRPEERELLEGVLAAGYTDLARTLHPDDDRLFTWWAPWRNLRQRNIGWRIDYVLATAPMAERVESCEVLREIGTSDHAPVVATFR